MDFFVTYVLGVFSVVVLFIPIFLDKDESEIIKKIFIIFGWIIFFGCLFFMTFMRYYPEFKGGN